MGGFIYIYISYWTSLQWRHNGRDSVSNHQPHDCFLNRLFRSRSKTTSRLRVTGLFAGNSSWTGAFAAQTASNAENVSIWWRHHDIRPSWKTKTDLSVSGTFNIMLSCCWWPGDARNQGITSNDIDGTVPGLPIIIRAVMVKDVTALNWWESVPAPDLLLWLIPKTSACLVQPRS